MLGVAVAAGVATTIGGSPAFASPVVKTSRTESARHRTAYLEAGPTDGPLMIFLHGWPGLSVVWRRQLEYFAAAGWHCVAPDLRGFGGSSAPADLSAYALSELVQDMVELHDGLGGQPAVWVGHDWGCAVVWAVAAHHARRCRAVITLTTPYIADGLALRNLVPLVNRSLYPSNQYPAGQWDYYADYYEHLDRAVQDFEADTHATLNVLYQRTPASVVGTRATLADVRRRGGWFGDAHRAPTVPRDPSMLAQVDFDALVSAYLKTGFRSTCAIYLNDEANLAFAAAAPGRRLHMPALFVHARRDVICDTAFSALPEPMRQDCADLTETTLDGGHGIMIELPEETNEAITRWLVTKRL
ncbi:alpha/beta hydrolase [Amycolatopsis sp. NPDC051061]|uniref:alpha/beta fold hydrolase n=1 Tax=Amycolatopsis sp. NPDC051061 TaxID=3155042 RepID=UPI0034438B47